MDYIKINSEGLKRDKELRDYMAKCDKKKKQLSQSKESDDK